MDQVKVPYREGFEYGMGVQRARANPLGKGVEGEITKVHDAGGGAGTFTLSQVKTTEEVETHLGISAEASGGVGLFSFDARFNFCKDCKVQSSSIVLILSASEKQGFCQIDEPLLTSDAAALTEKGKLQLFSERYGDCFVRGMHTGGQFFGVIRIDTQSEESRQRISASLSGSYGTFSGKASVDMTEQCKKEKASIYTNYYYEGGRVTKRPMTPAELLEAHAEWAATVISMPTPYQVTLCPYVIARGPEPPNAIDLEHQQDVLVRCARLRSKTIDKMNAIEYILSTEHAVEFDATVNASDLQNFQTLLARDLDIIKKAASYAMDNPKDALEPEMYARQVKGLTDYSLAVIPALPRHIGPEVIVPDFRYKADMNEVNALAAANQLKLNYVVGNRSNKFWQVDSQSMPPGSKVAPGTTIDLIIAKVVDGSGKIRFGGVQGTERYRIPH